MTIGLVGRKCGMTRVFGEDGSSVPVTVIEVTLNRITQVKTVENDGYQAVQVTAGIKKASRVKKPLGGHFAKAKVEPGLNLWEFRLAQDEEMQLGSIKLEPGVFLKVEDVFSDGQYVDVVGTSKGKGFAGAVKRHHFRTQDATHGNSLSHRAPGSIGQNQSPGKVFKGKKMAGHLGDKRITIQNQEIVKIDLDRQLLLIKGAVPGSVGRDVLIVPTVKRKHSVEGDK